MTDQPDAETPSGTGPTVEPTPAQTQPAETVPESVTPAVSGTVSAAVAGGPVLSLREAIDLTSVSRSTFQRRRADLIEAGATVSPEGWRIPFRTLVDLGFHPRQTPPDAEPVSGRGTPDTAGTDTVAQPLTPHLGHGAPRVTPAEIAAEVSELRVRLEATERRATDAELRAAVAEAVADERDRIIDAQRFALRMLEARPVEPEPPAGPKGPPPSQPPTSSSEDHERRRGTFFRRR